MLEKVLFSYSVKREAGIKTQWSCTIFGWVVPGSNWTGLDDLTENTSWSQCLVSLENILLSKDITPFDDILDYRRKTTTTPLLSVVVGRVISITEDTGNSKVVMREGIQYTIKTQIRKTGRRLLMPWFPTEVSTEYVVESTANDTLAFGFFYKEWRKLNRLPLDNEIINQAIKIKKIADGFMLNSK